MDLMTAISNVPAIGPALPYIILAMVANALIIAPSLATPSSPSGFYAFIYRVVHALAGNFGNAKNAIQPPSSK